MSGPLVSASAAFVAKNSRIPPFAIEQSLRFDGSSTYLEWYDTVTPDPAARKLWTLSMWVKRGSLSTTQSPFSAYQNSNNRFRFTLGSDDKLSSEEVGGGASKLEAISGGVYRDPSAWYHLVVIYDTDAASSENRLRLYVNGVDDSPVAPSTISGWAGVIGDNGTYHNFGSLLLASRSSFWNGYIAEVHLVAGQGKEPTAFGEYDDNGVWRPIKYTGSYGTHGYYLKFDPTATNGIGHDHSGNGNHWTPTGFDTNPASYVLATKTSGTFSTGTLRDVFDASSGAAGGVYQEATTGSTAASTIDIEFDSPLSGTITVEASDGTGGTNNGGQYQLIDSTDTVQVTQARPTNTTTFTHTGLSDITKLRMYGGSSGLGGILISRFESSDQTIRSADWLALTDVMSDTPTTNWCTLNPLAVRPSYIPTFSEGNLKVTHRSGTGQYSHCGSTIAFDSNDSSGYYCEVKNGAQSYGGVSLIVADYGVHNLHPDVSNGFSTNTNGGIGYDSNGYIRNFGTTIDYTSSASYNSGSDILGVAVKDNKVWFSINGSWIASGNPSTGANPVITLSSTQTFVVGSYGQGSRTFIKNFGQRAFAYTPPTGFKALNTSNLSAPTIKDGSKHFDTKTYTANNSTAQSITGMNFSPDLLWFKTRSRSEKHIFYDTVRGAGDRWVNAANESSAEITGDNSLVSFDSNGFSLGIDGAGILNWQTDSMVAWAWETGSAYGFNIVEYTGANEDGNGNIDVSHGLGVTPEFCIVRNLAGNEARVWHISLGNTLATTGYPNPELRLTNTGGSSSPVDSFRGFNSTIARFGPNGGTNQSGNQHIAYFWTGVEGFSKFGSYTGNGSTDGPFVFCGFKPRWVLFKRTDSAENWQLYDTARNEYNVVGEYLLPNSASAGATIIVTDIVSNGFKIRVGSGNPGVNASGGTYLFAAFAEHPFGGSGVNPATAR